MEGRKVEKDEIGKRSSFLSAVQLISERELDCEGSDFLQCCPWVGAGL